MISCSKEFALQYKHSVSLDHFRVQTKGKPKTHTWTGQAEVGAGQSAVSCSWRGKREKLAQEAGAESAHLAQGRAEWALECRWGVL